MARQQLGSRQEGIQTRFCSACLLIFIGLLGSAALSSASTYQLWPVIANATGSTLSGNGCYLQNCFGQSSSYYISDSVHSIQIGFLNNYSNSTTPVANTTATSTPTAAATPTVTPTPINTAVSVPSRFFKAYNSKINPIHNEKARLRWAQPQDGNVTIRIFNLLGDKIITLVNQETYSSGRFNEVFWNGKSQSGNIVGSGIYIVLLETPRYTATVKVAVLK